MQHPEKIRIIIVDDHPIVIDGIKILLMQNQEVEIVGEANSGESLLSLLDTVKSDIVILDIFMPGMSGVEVTKILKNQYPEIGIVVFTGNTEEEVMLDAIEAGATSIIQKNSSQAELVDAIKSVHSGGEYFDSEISKLLMRNVIEKIRKNEAKGKQKTAKISEREEEIIKLFCQGCSYKEISALLNISVHTVESHKVNILKKLKLKNVIEMVKYAIKHGIIEV